jgi:hypothetical protein
VTGCVCGTARVSPVEQIRPCTIARRNEIGLLHSLKDFRQLAHKRAAAVKLCETPKSNADSWHEAEQLDDDDQDCYGLGSDLYDTISAHPDINSRHRHFESFLDKLEMEFVNIMKSLLKLQEGHVTLF